MAKELNDVTPSLLRDKVRNMRNKYTEAVKWSKETGQGIKDSEGYPNFEGMNLASIKTNKIK